MLCLDTKLSDTEQCNTNPENLPIINITNKNKLKKYQNRNMWNEKTKKYELIGMNEDLIGKKIRVASPMTCSCKDGICKNCYGKLYKTISTKKLSDGRTIKENIGMIAVLLLTEVLTQMLLSTKHLLEANTEKIDWHGLDKYFEFISNTVLLKDEYTINNIKILDYSGDTITKLSINNEVFELPLEFTVNENKYSLESNEEEDCYYLLNINEEDEDSSYIFKYTVKNKELSGALSAIQNLLNTNEIKERDISGNINYMLDLLDEVGFSISSEHVEVIMRELILINDRSDFEKETVSYEFVRASEKVLKSSVIKSLLFERLESQLLDPETYNRNNEDSLLDFLL